MKQVHLWRSTNNPSTGTSYVPVTGGAWTTTIHRGRHPWAVEGHFNNLSIYLQSPPGEGKSLTFTLVVNDADTDVTVTISDDETSGVNTDGSAPIEPGQRVTLRCVGSGTPATSIVQGAIDFNGLAAHESGHGGALASDVGVSGTGHSSALLWPLDIGGWNGPTSVVAVPGDVTAYYVECDTIGAGVTFVVAKNNVVQDGTGGTPDTRVILSAGLAGSVTFSLPVVAGDTLSLSANTVEFTFPSIHPSTGVRFRATNEGESNMGISPTNAQGASATLTTYYRPAGRPANIAYTATESDHELRAGVTSFTLSGLIVAVSANQPEPTIGYAVTTRINQADTSQSVTLLGTSIVGSSNTPVLVQSGERWTTQFTPVNGPVIRAFYWAYGQLEVAPPPPPIQRVTQLVRQLGIDEDAEPPTVTSCTGGGEIPEGTTPTDGADLSTATTPHAWVEVTIAGTTYRWAGKSIPRGNPKSPRVLSWGGITRALTDSYGGVEESKATIRLSDVDHQLRTLHDTVTLRYAPAAIYVADEATIRAGGTPWRVFRGRVYDFRPEQDLTYTLVLEDLLSALLFSAHAAERPLPAVLVDEQFGLLGPFDEVLDTPAPWIYGSLQAFDQTDPHDGTVLALFVGAGVVPGHESLGALYTFLLGIGVATKVVSLQLADPAAPTPQRRTVSIAEYGSRIYVPSQPGWLEADPWSVRDGRRYTLIHVDPNHPAAELAREGRIPIIANLCGYDEVGDASGGTINQLPRQIAHLLNNFVFQDATADWLAQVLFSGESAINTDSVERCVQIGEARLPGSPVSGYVGAFVHGHSYQQVTLRDTIQQACRSGDMDLGISRHGQIIFVMLDRDDDAAGSAHFNQQDHVIKSSFRIDPNTDEVENEVRYVYARNYVPALHGEHTVEVRLPREPYDAEWLSGLQRITDESSITAQGGRPQGLRQSRVLEFDMVRDQATADDVAAQYLARVSHPNGRAEATFSLLATKGLSVELGDVIRVTHTHGIGASGWVARRVQVRRVQVDLDRMTVTLTSRDVDDLLP